MQIELDIKLTPTDLFRYNLRQCYRGISGISSIVIALLLFAMGAVSGYSGETAYMVLYIAAGFVILIYIPFSLKGKAAQTIRTNPILGNPLHYIISSETVAVTQGEDEGRLPWTSVYYVVETKYQVLIFTTRIHAYVLPKDQLGEENYATLMQIVHEQLPEYRLKLK